MRDPINIPEIRTLLRKFAPRTTPGTSKRILRSSRRHIRNLGALDLPLDIRFLILDHTSAADIPNTLTATEWQIPESYWRSRFPRDIVFEIEEIPPTREVHWERLCLETEKLLEKSTIPGLQNRQRIIRVLKGTKKVLLSHLAN